MQGLSAKFAMGLSDDRTRRENEEQSIKTPEQGHDAPDGCKGYILMPPIATANTR